MAEILRPWGTGGELNRMRRGEKNDCCRSCHLLSLLTPRHQKMLHVVQPEDLTSLLLWNQDKRIHSSSSIWGQIQASEGRIGGRNSQKHWLEVITHQEISLSVNVEDIKSTRVVSSRMPLYKHSKGKDARRDHEYCRTMCICAQVYPAQGDCTQPLSPLPLCTFTFRCLANKCAQHPQVLWL